MKWLRKLFRRPVVVTVPTEQDEWMGCLITGLSSIAIRRDLVIQWEDGPLEVCRHNAGQLVDSLHDCLHIIRSKSYFTGSMKASFNQHIPTTFYVYMTDADGYYYTPSSFIDHVIDKLTNIHHLLDEPQYSTRRSYYLKQLGPLLSDVETLLLHLSPGYRRSG